ncbi:MAG TPA: FKBP-type peptidyl-prolyl cis-trans isomerase [Gammaproteobacteria bacterium]
MTDLIRRSLLLAGMAVFLLTGCSDGDEAQQQEQADTAAQTEQPPAEQAPATPAEPQDIPAPENVAAAPAEAAQTPNGVAYIILSDAAGDVHPTVQDTVTVHYTGWTTDGRMFDSSVVRGEPASFPLGSLIPGWQEAVPLMTVGDKYRFWIPGKLAYDSSTRAGAPKGMLVFDIELLGIGEQGAAQEDPDTGGNEEGAT